MIGAMAALPIMLESRRLDPAAAAGMGIVHKIAPAADLVRVAKDWIKANAGATQPWDKKEYRIPGGGPFSASGAQVFTVGNAMLRQKTYDNYLAMRFMMSAVYEGLLVDIDTALKIEARYFVQVLTSPITKNMIRSLFQSMQELGKGARRPAKEPPVEVNRLGVLGAGVMGAGIAYVSAVAGIDVTLIDTTLERANAGKDHASKLLDHEISRGRTTPENKMAVLSRIHPTPDFGELKDVDLVIEAVFEERQVKAEATKEDRGRHRGERDFRLQYVDAPDHWPRRSFQTTAELHRRPLLLAGRTDDAGGDHFGETVGPEGTRDRDRLRAQDSQDSHRRERSPRLLHFALLLHLHARRSLDGDGEDRAGAYRECRTNVGDADGAFGGHGLDRHRHSAQNHAAIPQGGVEVGEARSDRGDHGLDRGDFRAARSEGRQGLLRV
jgi:hypothetical protein